MPIHTPGAALFLTNTTNAAAHLQRNRVLHEQVVLVTVQSARVPFVSSVQRLAVAPLGGRL